MAEILYVVIPCYNEEEVILETTERLDVEMNRLIQAGKISSKSRVLYVNDGSSDKTWDIIKKIYDRNKLFGGVNLSRNRGHQNALLSGLLTAEEYADIVISMDADLQDDINVIELMVDKYYDGNDIVYGVRNSREKDTFFKKFTAESFYKIMRKFGVDLIFNHADCRLMSKRALKALAEFREVNLFLRGIVPQIGFSHSIVEYERNERFAGESKYPLRKMLSFAKDGITSFSNVPIKFITMLGISIFLLSLFMLVWFLYGKFIGATLPGWASIVISIWMLGGLQLLAIGVVGEYIGKSYMEVKRRPRYIIEQILLEK